MDQVEAMEKDTSARRPRKFDDVLAFEDIGASERPDQIPATKDVWQRSKGLKVVII